MFCTPGKYRSIYAHDVLEEHDTHRSSQFPADLGRVLRVLFCGCLKEKKRREARAVNNLRYQFLAGYLLLAFLMVIVMAGAAISFRHLGRSIDQILVNNYASVRAAQAMKETLERQDSAATFFLAGQVDKARRQYEANWPLFEQAYQIEAHNITEPGEQEMADDIRRQFTAYRTAIEKLLYANPPLASRVARDYYFQTLEHAFLKLKNRAQDVLDLNQKAIVAANQGAKEEARAASIRTVGITFSAFVAAILFGLAMTGGALRPLRSLARQAEEIGIGHFNQRIEVHRSDEIGMLADSFNTMAAKLRDARRLEQERLHRAERMSDAALHSLYDPVIVTDARGSIVHLNRAAEGLFGPATRAAGRPVNSVVLDERISRAVERAVRHETISAAEDETDFVPLESEGSQRVYRVRATPMRDEDLALLGAAVVLEDVTHLREIDRLKTEFISVASHELRTPVTSLLLSVQILEEETVGMLTPGQREIVHAQREDLQRLERMMRDLLDITRLQAGVTPPRFEFVHPGELVDGALIAIRADAEAQGISLRGVCLASLPRVRADPAQITRVLINLLNNAVRHTPKRGCVSIEAKEVNNEVLFTVRDTGVGIPHEYLPRIFERFVQVPGATRGGSGLGLFIAQTLVNAHGGKISVESEPGKGSSFHFALATPGETED